MAVQPGFSIVFLGRFPGKDRAVAQALAQAFGRDDNWGLQIVGASPIHVLTGLTAPQAQAVYEALVEVEKVGCRFKIVDHLDPALPLVNQPADCKIFGRTVGSFGMVARPRSSTSANAIAVTEVVLPCPYTGQPMILKLILSRADEGSAPQLGVSAAPARGATPVPGSTAVPTRGPAAPIPIPIPKPAAAQGATPVPIPLPAATPIPLPAASATPVSSPAAGRPSAPGRPGPRNDAAALEPIDVELEELHPARPESPSSVIPLPEVPVVESMPMPMPAAHASTSASLAGPQDPRIKGPMALEDFEAGLKMGPSDVAPAPSGPDIQPGARQAPARNPGMARTRQPSPQVPMPQAAAAPELEPIDDDPDSLCSIFISRTSKPEVHELVAEIQGITTEEAQRHCQKAVVPIVKNIPVAEADAIRQRFKEINVNPRVVVKR
ncbi:MAG: hypothetical protein HS116_05315 [Planctomycetes bacterium]|nr:hypothetical protein [Planctomycetota bacterium]